MKIKFYKFSLLFILTIMIMGCGKSNEQLSLQRKLDSVEAILEKQNNDTAVYNIAASLFNNQKYNEAISKFQDFKINYPNSNLIASVDGNIKECKERIVIKEKEDNTRLNNIIVKAKQGDIETTVNSLQNFLNNNVSENLKSKAEKELENYKEQYAKIEEQRKLEKELGIQITEVTSEWDVSGVYGEKLFKPEMKIKVKNISSSEIDNLKIYVQFQDKEKGEVFGDNFTYVVSSSDPPLSPGFTKTAFISSDVGYKSDMAALNLPNLIAKIYAEKGYNNKIYLKEVKISKKYLGMDFSK